MIKRDLELGQNRIKNKALYTYKLIKIKTKE